MFPVPIRIMQNCPVGQSHEVTQELLKLGLRTQYLDASSGEAWQAHSEGQLPGVQVVRGGIQDSTHMPPWQLPLQH